MRRIILASQSPRRKELLEQIGIDFECFPADIDEHINEKNPINYVKILSVEKAESVAKRFPDDIILAADTVVVFDNHIMGKPEDEAEAAKMLKMLSGNKHTVYTGVCVIVPEKYTEKLSDKIQMQESFVTGTDVYMNEISNEEIEEYIATKEFVDKAGAYAIQGRAAAFVRKISGDYYNVVGLPVSEVYGLLKKINDLL